MRCGFCTLTPPCGEACGKDRLTPALEARLAKLDALEAGGVDNWEGYDEAMRGLHEDEEDDL